MLILLALLLVPVVIFAVQNAELVSLSFLGWSLSINMAFVVLGSLLVGLVIGAAWSWLKGGKPRGQVRDLTRSLEASTAKIKELERTLGTLGAGTLETEPPGAVKPTTPTSHGLER